MLDLIKNLLEETKEASTLFKRTLVKDYLQLKVLSFIYSQPKYQDLVFYGGSCLKHCFNLPRLSEDLDFVTLKGKINLKILADDIEKFFEKKVRTKINTKIQKFRIYLKFPILDRLDLAKKGESGLLILKIEIFRDFNFCKDYKIEIIPLFERGESVLVRTFDLSTLMATKIRAILHRKWEKTDKKGKTLAKVKGRDYYDLMWYLGKNVKPNLKCIEDILSKKELKKKLLEAVKKVDAKSIEFDLESLIKEKEVVKDLGKNIREILINQLKKIAWLS